MRREDAPAVDPDSDFFAKCVITCARRGLNTVAVPAGPFKGQTMIPGPFDPVSDYYLTDQREFSNEIHGIAANEAMA